MQVQVTSLAVTGLACRRAGRLVLDGVSFKLASGEGLVVTGRNGAGKSTLLACLAGRLRPERGTIHASGTGDLTLPECLHLVGHRDALKGSLTAGENLDFARAVLGSPRLTTAAALEAVGLGHAASLPVGLLSAGQRRRVALARLLVAHRPLWLLDEPATALDLASAARLADLVRDHLAGGGLVVAATHAPLGVEALTRLELRGRPAAPAPASAWEGW